ncbi:MAG TPA: FlgO family outer membrane protein [Pyrinomonadaceae bacterium]|nr:FlgO family outer membrane protein [Pyrinomonadaceae bacterium]
MNKLLILIYLLLPAHVLAQGNVGQRIEDLTRQISAKVTAQASSQPKTTIAVVEFADLEGRVNNFGRFVAEELITRLHESNKFKVIERQLLNKIITEQKLSLTGIVDPASAKKLGRLLGVEAIVSGSVTDLSKTLRVNARMISTETGEIFAVASTEFVKDETVLELLGAKSPAGAESTSGGATPNKFVPVAKDSMGFTVLLKQCKLSATAVTCDLEITSNDMDRGLSFYIGTNTNPSRLYDDAGSEHFPAQVRLGTRVGEYVESLLVAGVPFKASIRFEGIPASSSKASLLRVRGSILLGTEIRDLVVEYRDVSLVK